METIKYKGWCFPQSLHFNKSADKWLAQAEAVKTLEPLFREGRRRVAVDVGAFVGTFTIPLSDIFERVHCFEPFSDAFVCLGQNCFGRENIVGYNKALLNINGKARALHNKKMGCIQIGLMAGQKAEFYEDMGYITCHTLDSYNFENVDFLKVDTDNLEVPVLEGSVETIDRCRPVIYVEIKNFEDRVSHFMLKHGYVLVGGDDINSIYLPEELSDKKYKEELVISAEVSDGA